MSLYDLNPLDDEEERKKREAIAARMDEEAYANPVGPVTPSFLDTAGQMIGNRFNAAMDRVSNAGNALMNPQQALQQRMINDQRQQQQEEQANTEVQTQTTKTFGDGSQEHTVKTQIPAGQETAGAKLTTPIPGMPQNLPAQGSISPEQANAPVAMAQLPKAGPQVQVAGATQMPAQAAPQQQTPLPTGAVSPANYSLATGQGQPSIRMPQMAPQQGQVAATPGASLAQMGAGAQAQPRPAVQGTPYTPTAEREVEQPRPWVQAANDAGTDFYKLLDVANKHPESKDMIYDKLKSSFKQQTMKDDADAIMKAAQAGDLKAQNKILQSIKPETGKPKEEVTVGDYLKAVLYKRLGLDAMALDVQNKIIGKETKFGQVKLGGANWETETDSSGRIIRAKDNEGNFATESTLNQLRAGAEKFGTHTTSFTGGIHTVPNAEGTGVDLVMPTQNAITGQAGFTYASGPKQGQTYTGGATPQPQSVGTSFQKALDKAMIDFKTSPSIAGAKAAMDKAYVLDPGDGSLIRATQAQINANSPEIFNQVRNYSPSGNVAEQLPAGTANADEVARAQRNIESINRELAKPKPAGFSQKSEDERRKILQDELAKNQAIVGKTTPATTGGSLAQRESNIKVGEEVAKARQKPPAEALGKGEAQDIVNQRSADESYGLIQPVADLIKQSTGSGIGSNIDKLAAQFGVGTKGAQAIDKLNVLAYQFEYSIPRFEGPQSNADVEAYRKAAGNFADETKPISRRLAALQGMIFLLKKYDKAGNNDWTFGGQNPTQTGQPQKGTKENPIKLN